jgi:adenine-specific DNA methylase
MSQDELPIERGFPIERVNEIAEKESRAKMHYRPIYTMHKWWARRLGCVFRTICLYALLDDPEKIEVREPGDEQETLSDEDDLAEMLANVSLSDPEALWDLYPKDVRVEDKKILDPFMGGGTSLVEASRFGVESEGWDLNPVAWFVTKKQLEAGQTDVEDLEAAFEEVEDDVADEITRYYRTPCPNAQSPDDESLDQDDPLGLAVDGDLDFDYEVPADLRDDLVVPGHHADVMYDFWVKELDCVDCGATVSLFKDYRVAKGRYENDDKYNVLCPACESVVLVDDWQSESTCSECYHEWTPKKGTVSGSKYVCHDCGAQYGITDAIGEQGGFNLRLYAVEYYCPTCDDRGLGRSEVKGYKKAEAFDEVLYHAAEQEWEQRKELREYVPDEEIPEGAITAASSISGNDVFQHSYRKWTDFYNDRQLVSLARLLQRISKFENNNIRENMLIAFSETLNYANQMVIYQQSTNKGINIFKSNSFDPPVRPVENNLWGTEYGAGNFQAMFNMVLSGIKYAKNPTERYVQNGSALETEPFDQPIGENATVHQGDMRSINAENEYDAVITDPPYYDNIIYSEVADYFYVWQKILLEDDYDCFQYEKTPRTESIVTNPFYSKTEEDFESELHEAFTVIRRALKKDGVLAFTYHHSDSESWGELLAALCDVGFEVTATHPISADVQKFISGDAVEFDILIVARPSGEREGTSWPKLRQRIFETARETRQRLEENRDLSRGDIGVIEMGECFHEYSKHHGNVHREGEIMTAKEVVDEIYGIIQEASDIGTTEVFLDLLRENADDSDAVNKLCRSANTRPEELEKLWLFNTDDEFELGTWDNEKRIAFLEDSLREGDLSDLGKLQYLRYRYDRENPIGRYVQQWIDADLRELASKLVDATGDPVYQEMLDIRSDEASERDLASGPDNQYSIDDFS